MEKMMERKNQAVHKHLDSFELRVLERSATTIDVTTFYTELAKLRSDVDALLTPLNTVPEVAPTTEENEVVMIALLGDTMPPPDPSHDVGKRHHFDHTSDTEEAY
uniref:Integrase core domain containing protein n=1 Tax=Solanum tuberosum TaxID=4113 RepID=M1DNT2_SOLTU